ncbi:MAG: nitronate monooxygenase [Ignavibacteriaceae bacterium]|nr:nitronate monooxygenase [Ignavibacteriaceae bacterium]
MKLNTQISRLLGIKYPIVQAGMVWVSGWRLASAVSNCEGLGLIGSGSMKPELLREHIRKCFNATDNPFGVNIPLLREDAADLIDVTIKEGIKIVFTSAGSPAKFIDILKKNEIKVVHVVSSVEFGIKAEKVGCDAVVGEGVEAGGHNGAEQITTLCLIPQLSETLKIPVIAAGGIADGRGILAAITLGAKGVQLGTRFAATVESSAHPNYKRRLIEAGDGDTVLAYKRTGLVRMLINDFAIRSVKAEEEGWSEDQLKTLLGRKREKLGIFEGDETEGEMEAGQGTGLIKEILSVKDLFNKLITEFNTAKERICV